MRVMGTTAGVLTLSHKLPVYNCLAADNALTILFSDRQYTSSLEAALSKMAQIKGAEVTST